MVGRLAVLSDEIKEELSKISQLMQDLRKVKKNESTDIEIRKRVYASLLADFYMGVERIFKLIAREIDGELPEGEEWHKKLLRQMSVEIPEIRPAVIDKNLFYRLEEYLKLRHLVRNIYGFQLDYRGFSHLVEKMEEVFQAVEQQVIDFLNEMQAIARSLNDY